MPSNLKVIKQEDSKAILNVDYEGLEEYKKRRKVLRKKNSELEDMQIRLNNLENAVQFLLEKNN